MEKKKRLPVNEAALPRKLPGMNRLRGFSLPELLLCLVLLAAGPLLLKLPGPESPEREARELLRQLVRAADRADRTRTPFLLWLPVHEARKNFRLRWQSIPAKETVVRVQNCSLMQLLKSCGASHLPVRYDPQWGTFTPSLLIEVFNPGGKDPRRLFIVGSESGRLRLSDRPPSLFPD